MFCLVKEKQHTHSDINSQDKASRTYSSIVIILLVYSKELSAYTVISEGETANDENIRRLLRVISFWTELELPHLIKPGKIVHKAI